MPSASKRKPPTRKAMASREKVHAHRKRLRAQGLRPIQIWVPDTRSPKFAAAASRQSLLVASSAHAAEDQAFIDSLSMGVDE
jgi:antidote-toxin recognition MazE-like antitoxin